MYNRKHLHENNIKEKIYKHHDINVLVKNIHKNVYTSCYTAMRLPVEALIEMEGCAGAPGPQEKRQHEVTKLGFIISDLSLILI